MPARGTRPAAAVLALVLAPACAGALTDAERDALLDRHNAARAAVEPPAADMARLAWDPALAAVAQAWAQRCTWAHNPGHDAAYARLTPGGDDVGENLYVSTHPRADTLAGAVRDWAAEAADYSHATGACAPGRACGHYTQLAWAATRRVGCGVQRCPSVAGLPRFRDAHLVVCDYAPAGNIVGRRPYTAGPRAGACPPPTLPAGGLCAGPPGESP